MTITAITIENFKGFKDPIRIAFKPITLLFGPNSAGKSTVIQALHYMRGVLEHGNVNSEKAIGTISGLDIGGFEDFIHRKDKSNPISLKLEIDVKNVNFFKFTPDGIFGEAEEGTVAERSIAWIKLTIAWSPHLQKPDVSIFEIGFGSDSFFKVFREGGTKGSIKAEITADKHIKKIFLTQERQEHDDEEGLIEEQFYEQNTLKKHLSDLADYGKYMSDEEWDSYGRDNYERMKEELYEDWEPREEELNRSSKACEVFITNEAPRKILIELMQKNVIPDLERRLEFRGNFSVIGDRINIGQKLKRKLVEYLDMRVLGLCGYTVHCLQKLLYIGPIRAIPGRDFAPQSPGEPARWSNGLAAWDYLYGADLDLINQVNYWLGGNGGLDSGYQLSLYRYKEVDVTASFFNELSNGCLPDISEIEEIARQCRSFPLKQRLYITDQRNKVDLKPHDIGIGISQVIPVIVSALLKNVGIVCIEQPELHVHPALQVALGDLFIENCSRLLRPCFLLETHSEHLMLRLLRRIRETDEGLGPKNRSLTPDMLAVYFIEPKEGGASCHTIKIDEQGEFLNRWPKGFFDERMEELF